MRHRIEVRADDPARQAGIAARQSQIKVAGGIGRGLQAEVARGPPHHLMGDLLAGAEGGAGDAGGIAGPLAQLVEEPPGEPDIDRKASAHPPLLAAARATIRGHASGLTRCAGRRPASTSTICCAVSTAVRSSASCVDAATCGLSTTLSSPTRGESSGSGSFAKT